MVPQLVLDERARRVVELAFLEATVDRGLEALVDPLAARILGRPERDVRGEQDRRIEQHEPLDAAAMAGGVLERDPSSERVAQPEPGLPDGGLDGVDMVGEAPRGLARRVAVAQQVGSDDAELRREPAGEALEVAAAAGDPVEADDGGGVPVAP